MCSEAGHILILNFKPPDVWVGISQWWTSLMLVILHRSTDPTAIWAVYDPSSQRWHWSKIYKLEGNLCPILYGIFNFLSKLEGTCGHTRCHGDFSIIGQVLGFFKNAKYIDLKTLYWSMLKTYPKIFSNAYSAEKIKSCRKN